jgi:hypothetical protein
MTVVLRRSDAVGLGIVVLVKGPATAPHRVAEDRYAHATSGRSPE